MYCKVIKMVIYLHYDNSNKTNKPYVSHNKELTS